MGMRYAYVVMGEQHEGGVITWEVGDASILPKEGVMDDWGDWSGLSDPLVDKALSADLERRLK